VNYALMSNEFGERWSVITLTNLVTGNSNFVQEHLIALFLLIFEAVYSINKLRNLVKSK
jgi:hypothetical protein